LKHRERARLHGPAFTRIDPTVPNGTGKKEASGERAGNYLECNLHTVQFLTLLNQ
jgi:hypothetical protein